FRTVIIRRDHLKSPRPVRLANSPLYGICRYRELRAELFRSRNRQGDIAHLMTSNKRRLHGDGFPEYLEWILGFCSAPAGPVPKLRARRRNGWNIRYRTDSGRLRVHHRMANYVIGFRRLWQGHKQSIVPDDPGFLSRNLSD